MPDRLDGPLPDASDPPARRLTILVVDDDALICMNTAGMLEDLGHVALEANSGEEALQILGAEPRIDLVITDFSMPNMSGGDLARRAQASRPGLPFLLATGYTELPPGSEIDLPKLGKPFQQRELIEAINAAMIGRPAT